MLKHWRSDARKQTALALEHDNIGPERSRRRGGFKPHISPADDGDALARPKARFEPFGVRRTAQNAHMTKIRSWNVQASSLCA